MVLELNLPRGYGYRWNSLARYNARTFFVANTAPGPLTHFYSPNHSLSDLKIHENSSQKTQAILQWLAASEGRRRLLYFPFDLEHLGPQLTELSRDLCTARVTVGQLYSALMSEPRPKRATEIFEHLKRKLLG